jgi:MFS family permease
MSGVGDGVRFSALPLLTAALTQDPTAVAGMTIAQGIPWLLFSLPAGALTDRWDRRHVLVHANAVQMVLMGSVAIAVGAGTRSLPLFYLLGFGLSTAQTFADSATQALVPALVPKAGLERANSRLYAVETTTTQFVGPPLGSAAFALRQPVPFVLDAGTFAAAALLLGRIRSTPPQPPERQHQSEPLRAEISVALRWMLRNRLLCTLAILIVVDNLLAGGFYAVLVLFAIHVLHLGQARYGLLTVAYGVGALLGSLLAARAREPIGTAPAITLSMMLAGAPLLVIGLVPHALVVAAMMAIMGAGESAWGVLTVALRQKVIPEEMLGRVFSVYRLVVWAGASLGALLGGVLAKAFTLRTPAVIAGVLIPLVTAVVAPTIAREVARQSNLDEAS